MRRGAKPTKAKVKAKPPLARRSPKDEGSRVHDLEKRLAEAVAREAEALNRESEVVEQQAATAEILRSISAAPTDYQPVFDTIVRNAGSVCGAVDAILWTADGDDLVIRAHHGPMPGDLGARQPIQGSVAGRALSEARVVHDENLPESDDFPHGREVARRHGWHTTLSVPLLRQGVAVGAILIRRSEVRPFTPTEITLLQTFADQAVIAIENVRLFSETKEALERQTATTEILKVISESPTDVQPVFDAIVESCTRLLACNHATLRVVKGDRAEFAASSSTQGGKTVVESPMSIHDDSLPVSQAVLRREVVQIPDTSADGVSVQTKQRGQQRGFRSLMVAPLLRDNDVIGTINVHRATPGRFTEKEVALLETFASQAVIAIENARLFNETKEALERQTATADILRVIGSSPTDTQPVFEAIVSSGRRLFPGAMITVARPDGEFVRAAAIAHDDSAMVAGWSDRFTTPLSRDRLHGAAILDAMLIDIPDAQVEADGPLAPGIRNFLLSGNRAITIMPMLRGKDAIGVISVTRAVPGLLTDEQLSILRIFADQAVIAIENVRLFKELEGRNRDLTATSEILRVISSSPTDLQPVFDTIVRSAVRLCDATFGSVALRDGDRLTLPAAHGLEGTDLETFLAPFPIRLGPDTVSGCAILEARVVHVRDQAAELAYGGNPGRRVGTRSIVAVPMFREGSPIGAVTVWRREVRPFTDAQTELLKTFAEQAVIAIENVRLFRELEARTRELTESVEKLTALGEISQAVNSTLDVETVLQTIVSRASQLAGADGCAIYEYDDATEAFHIRATHNLDPGLVGTLRASPLRRGEGAMGRAAETREPTQVADIAVPGTYQSHIRETLLGAGYRALLSVPLLREGQVIGSLSLNRRVPGEFPPEAVEVLKTFATQSALAIQNARLFREIADKSAQLEAASRHKSEFLANMSHELRTPLNAIIGFSEVLTERMFGELNEKQDEYLKDINASGQHLLSLINDILDLSKIEAGRMELELADFDLPSAIDNALTLVRERASRRGITLGHSVDERLGPIRGDERKVKQVLLNLLSNALKFTPEGGRIDVSARVQDGAAEIAVTDTGVGIAPEDQEAVFAEFRQVGTADKKVEGTGLGLALSRKFIELHGGKICVKSQVGHGSTFTFTLPVRRED